MATAQDTAHYLELRTQTLDIQRREALKTVIRIAQKELGLTMDGVAPHQLGMNLMGISNAARDAEAANALLQEFAMVQNQLTTEPVNA